MIQSPLPDLAAWTAALRHAELPILARTASELALLAQVEEARGTIDAHLIGEAIEGDPLMTVRLMSYVGSHRPASRSGEAETVVAATMLMGIGPFFREFNGLESVEQRLADRPELLTQVRRLLHQSHRAARFALAFAVHRLDGDARAIHEATLLHVMAEMMLWLHAPAVALQLQARRDADPHARTAQLQQEVLNVRLSDLQHALMKAWKLPALFIDLSDPAPRDHALIAPQRRTVQLAIRLARHSATSWLDPAVPDDVREIAELLTLSTAATQRLLHRIDN